jgi:hypothetical protein
MVMWRKGRSLRLKSNKSVRQLQQLLQVFNKTMRKSGGREKSKKQDLSSLSSPFLFFLKINLAFCCNEFAGSF